MPRATEHDEMTMRIIGIDPGARTGIACYLPSEDRLLYARTTTFWDAYDEVTQHGTREVVVVVEDPAQIRPVFEHDTRDERQREKIAQNVGINKAHATLLVEGLERLGYTVRRRRPGGKKWNAKFFRRITGYPGRTSEHARDAARFVWGLTG